MVQSLFIAELVWIFCSPSLVSAAEHTKDSLEKVKQSVAEKKAVIVDVREQKEWDAGHLADAKLVPLSKLSAGEKQKDFAEQLSKEIPKDKVVYCHCRAGGRALSAADILKDLGYDVRPLKAGYQDLLDAGFPKAK